MQILFFSKKVVNSQKKLKKTKKTLFSRKMEKGKKKSLKQSVASEFFRKKHGIF